MKTRGGGGCGGLRKVEIEVYAFVICEFFFFWRGVLKGKGVRWGRSSLLGLWKWLVFLGGGVFGFVEGVGCGMWDGTGWR